MFKHTIPRQQWNLNLVDDLLAEKNVICSLAMQRLRKLVTNKFEFTIPDDSKVFADGYKNMLNAFKLFIDEACELQEHLHAGSQELWECYLEFCNNNNLPRGISRQLFAQKLEALDGVQKQRIRENGKQITIFNGIGIRSTLHDTKKMAYERTEKSTSGTEKPITKIRKEPATQKDCRISCTTAPYQFDVRANK